MSANHVIVVGGGLAGLSAAHTILERGGNVLLLDKNPFCGGNFYVCRVIIPKAIPLKPRLESMEQALLLKLN